MQKRIKRAGILASIGVAVVGMSLAAAGIAHADTTTRQFNIYTTDANGGNATLVGDFNVNSSTKGTVSTIAGATTTGRIGICQGG